MGAQALSPITTPSLPTDRTDSHIPKDPIGTSERLRLPSEPRRRADEMTATVTPVALMADASTTARQLADAGDRAARGRARLRFNRCCIGMADSIRRTQHCDCDHRRWRLEVLHRPEGLAVRVDPYHRPDCRAIELAAQRRQREATDQHPPPADYPPPAS